MSVSIRSPHKSKGRQHPTQQQQFGQSVSIRSPHKSKGRLVFSPRLISNGQFQSAPLTKARGDPEQVKPKRPDMSFNPLPSQKQGETTRGSKSIIHQQVSIRSPHKSKGRQVDIILRGKLTSFQSAPLTKARGDSLALGGWYISSGFQSAPLTKARGDKLCAAQSVLRDRFQSAPLTKARGDRDLRPAETMPTSFNPLPSQKQGETVDSLCADPEKEVSIRSPHKSKGRPNWTASVSKPKKFQSAPLTKARGDSSLFSSSSLVRCFNPLPSQKQGETPESTIFPPVVIRFQSAPLTKARGDLCWFLPCVLRLRFQSAPLTKARGDTDSTATAQIEFLFQSAPLTKARGDRPPAAIHVVAIGFNPLPSQKQGETRCWRNPIRV